MRNRELLKLGRHAKERGATGDWAETFADDLLETVEQLELATDALVRVWADGSQEPVMEALENLGVDPATWFWGSGDGSNRVAP